MFQKIIKISLFTPILLLLFFGTVFAEEDFTREDERIVVHFFDDRLCPVCKDAKNFIQEIKDDYPQMELKIYSISDTEKLNQIAKEQGKEDYRIMAPSIFIADNFFQFNQFTSREEKMIVGAIKGKVVEEDCCIINIPFLNIEVDISKWSLPFITLILGSIDGFNICSIGALILVLSIVLAFKSRKKIFFFGGLFIFTSVLIYGILVFVWGKLFEILVGQLEMLRIIVGLAAFGGGIYFFKEFWRFFKHGPTCRTSDSKLAKVASNKLKKAFEEPGRKLYLLAGSIIFFAIVITIVELPCSVGIPVAFAGILVEKGIPLVNYVFYMLFYLFFYMLIEMIVLTGAVLTKKIWFASSKAITWITFVGALVLFYLAFYYIIGF